MKYSLLTVKYFVDVVETQGFTPAAKRNFVSQTAISNAIKNLEKELKVQLIDRSTSHFKVTIAGVNLYHYAVPLLKQYYAFTQKVSGLDNTHNIMRIHYLRGFSYWTIQLARALKRTHPSIQLQLDTEKFSGSIPKLDSGDFDVLISFSTAVSKIKSIHRQKIGTANFGVLLNQGLLNAHGKIKKQAIAQQPLFLQKWSATDSNDVQRKIKNILHDLKIDYRHVIYQDSFDAALTNVFLGQGMAIFPKEVPIPETYAGQVTYLPDLPSLKYDVVAIYKNPAVGDLLSKSR
ncbi:LysR family transcriptional regulator [Lactobacillus xylocopicola]|uniref:HTH lysR-type domain-containing protein n=1 Tax=Lactobacillus xylocopicola TaxID=2976676 RepID=A0ABN6SJ23_9LACO|nr:LysR family transcriptional regulator [Lactobacillus xylocopicola]BDR60322.1 hypothetical protein KIM322_05830 [Lactobacillus xylocopicola]